MVALTLTPQLRSFLADVQAVVDGVGTKVLDDARIPQDEIGYMYKVVEKYHPGSAAAAGAESVKSVVSAKKRDDDTISKEVAETTLQTIHHKDLHRLSQFMLAIHSNDSKYSFRELVKGSKINVESPRPRVKSPELQKILNDVRTQLENQEYERMVRNVSTYTGEQRPLESFSKDLRNVSKLMSSIMNVLFSVGAAFVAVFYFSYTVSEDISVMASMRDAMRRLQVIYDACAPEAIEASTAEKNLDEFTRLKKRIHNAVKDIRVALKEREELLQRSGTTTETAEASYRARTMIRNLKEDTQRLDEIVTKEEKKKGKRKVEEDELVRRREIVQLCFQHIEECENLEKRRFNEKAGVDRLELLRGSVTSSGGPRRPYGITSDGDGVETNADRAALFEGAANARARKKADEDGGADPFLNSNLPDIDVDEDFEKLNERNKMIDQDLEDIEHGVKKLKELAQDMNQELDKQNEALKDLEKGVDQALDEVDNVNIKLKRALDHMMKGDRFMVNCILLCIILALVAFIASIFA